MPNRLDKNQGVTKEKESSGVQEYFEVDDGSNDQNASNININASHDEQVFSFFSPTKVNIGTVLDTPQRSMNKDENKSLFGIPPLHPNSSPSAAFPFNLESTASLGNHLTRERSNNSSVANSIHDDSDNNEVYLSRNSSNSMINGDEAYQSDRSTSRSRTSSFSQKTISALQRAKNLPIRRLIEVKKENVHLYNRCLNEIGTLILPYVLKKRFQKLRENTPFILRMELLKGKNSFILLSCLIIQLKL